ncbi:tyrosine-type recombinase/integrase [Sphingomonas sp.]|uniref:site-specific integrase n=1 Tax=Sphingomonas sp. TaxID=28214 RepID=UPI00307DC80A
MTKKKRFLPQHVTRYRDRHGKWRYRYRRVGAPGGHFKSSKVGSPEWLAELAAFEAEAPSPVESPERYGPGSVGALIARYCATPSRLGPTQTTQDKVRRILHRFRDEHGHKPVALLQFEHVDAILAKRAVKVWNEERKRHEGGIEAARKLRKELVRLFDFAVKLRMRSDNPVVQADRIKVAPGQKSKGFYSWTEGDIGQYRARHPLGTRARLAMELLLWTGQRRIDGAWLGPQHIIDGRIESSQTKTGKAFGLVIAPQLLEAITAMPPPPPGAPSFLLTEAGEPFSYAGFGNKMREWCDQAGLPRCTAHGLRKAMMRRLAERGESQQTLKSVSIHSRDEEVALYTAGANQRRMAEDAISSLAAWETAPVEEQESALARAAREQLARWQMSNPAKELDISCPKETENER